MAGLNSVVKLFEEKDLVKVCAPMVRYSKLEFRTLVRKYNCDLCFTPMIMADSFVKSDKAREVAFSTDEGDRPLIVQFAANEEKYFAEAAEMVAPYCDGIDLNCGCPQRWAMREGYGSALLSKPNLIKDLVSQLRNRMPKPFSISVKIRILKDMRKTIELCQAIEASGATFITVHGRTPSQRNDPVNIAALQEIRKSVSLPLIANGDVKTLEDARELQRLTGYNGVMSARGILHNPALYAGHTKTPVSCVEDFVNIAQESGLGFNLFYHHLVFMTQKLFDKPNRRVFSTLRTRSSVINHLVDYFKINVTSKLNSITTQSDIEYTTVPDIGIITSITTAKTHEDFLQDSIELYPNT